MSISDISGIPDLKDIPELPTDAKPVDLETTPSTSSENERNDLPLYRTERIIGSLTVAWVIILTTYMIFQNNELSYTSVYFLKIILSLSGAVMLATLPGFFDVSYTLSGFSVRAAGGAAAFVFIYTQSPNLPIIDKYQTSPAPPVEEQQPSRAKPNNEKISVLNDEYPVLLVLSVSPASFAPAFYQMQPVSHYGGGSDWAAVHDWQGVQSATFGASVMGGASAVIARVIEYLQAGFASAKSALDATATAVRGVVDGLIETARSLLGLQSGTAPPALNLFSEAHEGLLTGSLLDGDGGLAGSLYSAVDLVNSVALGGLGETLETVLLLTDTTLDPVIHLVDGTTQQLVGTVHGTTDNLLYTTDRLVGVVSGTLDRLTGGLTQPVGTLAHGTIGKVDKLTDAVLPAAADTASKVLRGVEGGLDGITGAINEISPKIISQLDSEFVAGSEKSGNALSGVLTELPENILGTPFPDLANATGVLEEPIHKLTSAPLLGGLTGQLLPLGDGPTCIAGCDDGPRSRSLDSSLRNTLKGVSGMISGGSNSGPVLGLQLGSGDGIGLGGGGGRPGLVGGLIGGVTGDSGPGGEAGAAGHKGGLISSTLNNTGTLLGNTLGKLKKK